ncbi:MAG: ComEA family DNA-binding protein [Fibrobacterota bacterium]
MFTRAELKIVIFLSAAFIIGFAADAFFFTEPAEIVFEKPEAVYKEPQEESLAESESEVNINTAGIEKLRTLPGIGPITAGAIVRYREKNGDFIKKKDIVKVRGIGKAKLESIIDFIVTE